MRISLLVFMMVFAAISPWASAMENKVCTDADADRAERGIDQLDNWQQVYESFARYASCDDGAVAEGYSDKIVKILIDHWSSATELFYLWREHPRFGDFVLLHIDELMSQQQANAIVKNAQTRCPDNFKAYCQKLAEKAAH